MSSFFSFSCLSLGILGHPRTESIIEGEESLEKYCAICEYEVEDSSQLSFPKGAIITVIDKDEDGKMKYNSSIDYLLIIIIIIIIINKYSWTLCHSISAIDHASLDGAV